MKSITDNLYKVGEILIRVSLFPAATIAIALLLAGASVYSQCDVFAGDDQNVCVNSTLILQGQTTGNLEGDGNITWEQIDGPAATIVSPNSLETEIAGLVDGNSYTFRISVVCVNGASRSDDVNVTVFSVSTADAGDDATFCNGGGVLAGNAPGIDETGQWSIIGNNFGIVISDPTSPTSAITLTSGDPGTALLLWTITHTNGCSSSDDVLITNAELSDAVIVSAPDVCGQSATTLIAEAPVSGTGLWTQESGPNSAIIDNELSATTTVSNLIAGTYVFKWTVSGDPLCDPKSQTAEFDVVSDVSAGIDQVLCNVTTAALNAGPVTSGTGTWIVASKPTGAPDPTFDPNINTHNATLNGLEPGVYELVWKIESGSCEFSDNVIITIRPPITIDEIPGATICAGGQHMLTAVANGGSGSYDYQWQYNNGVTWVNVGSNTSSFTTPELEEIGSYPARVIVSDQIPADNGGCQTTSLTTTINVVGDLSISVQPQALTTLCNSGNTTLSIVADENTGTPELLYQWQVSTSDTPFDWSDIDGANNASYTTPNLTQTTFYNVVLDAAGNGCTPVRSTVAEVEINNVDAGSIGSDQTLCNETTPAAFTSVSDATGEGVISYQWQVSSNGIDFTDIAGAELSTYAPGIVSDDTWYQRVATSTLNGVLCSAVSNVVKITVADSPVADDPGDFLFCNGATTGGITFSGTPEDVTFNWANSNPNIGLAASGTGNITSFTATNSTLAPIFATIEVTPVYTNGSSECIGTPVSFTITVNPDGHVVDPGNVVTCNNNTVSPIIFETGNSGGTTTYAWTNNNTSIGLAASGTGNITSFGAVNSGTEAIVATITVTPTFTSGSVSCEGASEQFTITVNPTPIITSNDELTICDQTALNYNPTANISGTTFSWTASVISGSATGFSAVGTGPITDVITNTQGGNAISVVRYVITPQSPAGCTGPTFNLDVSVAKCADLAISKTDGSTQFTPGTTVVYTVVVSNDGPSNAFGATVTDNAPSGTSISSWSAVFAGGASGNANGAGNLNENINIPRNATATYTISVNVPSTFTGNLVNTASISAPAGLVDNNVSNNSSSDTSTQNNQADLRIDKVGSPDPVVAGENIFYTITLTNDGPTLASNVEVQDVLPASLAFVSATPSKGSWAAPIWTIETMAVAETATLTIVATLNSNATSSVANTASVTSSTIDPNEDNNSVTETTSIVTSADLGIMKTASPEPALAGETLTYTIVVENNGPSNATNVLVNDILPSELTFVSATPTTGSWSAGTWSIGNLADGNQATLTLVTRVKSNVTTNIVNTATVNSNTPDPVPGNNSDATTTSVSTRADLSITKVSDNNPATAGAPVTYTLTVENNGPSDAINVRVQDVLPSQLQFVSATPQTGTWSAPFWTIGTLTSGQEVSLTIVANIDATATGTIFNTATVTSNTTDPVAANNTATHQQTVAASAVLSINKTAPASIIAGSQIAYTLIVSNQGPSTALNVLVTDNLPAGLSDAQYSIDGGNNWIAWTGTYTRATLAAGANFEVRLRANTSPGLTSGQVITNTAIASSPTAADDAQDSALTTVRRSADLVMVKTRAPGLVLAGQNIVYTLTVNNLGPSNAQNVLVTDILPNDLTFVSAVPQTGTWLAPEWNIGQVAAGASTSMQLTALVNPEVADGAVIVNEAFVLSNTSDPDPDPENNYDELAVSVNSESNLSVTKSVNNSTPNVGSTVVFTIRVSNQGPSNATGVVVTEQLPDGYSYVLHSGGSYNSASDIWTIGNLAIGNTVQLQITAIVNALGSYNNTATVDGNENDPDLSNNVATATVTPVAFADLAVNKTVNVPYQSVGQAVVFTVALTNNGPSPATSVQVVDNLPQGFTFQSASTSAGTYNNNTGIWSVGNLNAGSSVNLNITALVKVNGPYINSASASASENDPVAGNNSDNVGISVIHAVDDNFSTNLINGYTGGTAGNVLLNDLLQGNLLDTDDISLTLLDNDGLNGLSISANGNVIVPASSKAGVYNATYRICEDALPANCDIGVITIVVTSAPIVAVNDNFTASPINGFVGGTAGNVLSNDLLNNAAVTAAKVNILIIDNGGLSGVVINQAGLITVPAGTPAGNYVMTYQICEKLNPGNCDQATATILVAAASILAADDDFTGNPVSGIAGGIAGNVLSNDLLNGLAVNINNITITLLDNDGMNNLALDAQGRLVIPPGSTAGQYTFTYRICELLNPGNCDQAEVVVLISAASIIAGNDTFGPVNGYTGMAQVGNILANDILNGVAVNINEIDVSIVSIDDRLQLNVNTGVVGVLPSTPQGIYELEYRICETLNPENCDMAVATVTVVAANIVANNDSYGPVNGSIGIPNIGNILVNDMFNGTPVVMSEITLSVISVDSPLTINVETGIMGVLPGTASGNYSAEYQICEILNPTNCDNATVSVQVGSATIIANDDVFGPVNGYLGNSNLGNVLNNDILNADSVSADDVILSVLSSDSELISIDASTGIVAVSPGAAAGIYELEYRICEIINPENCNTANVSVVVVAAQIIANNDDFGPFDGVSGVENAGNILTNDLISGQEIDAGDVVLSIISNNFHSGITLNTSTGIISVAPFTPGGVYTMGYQICEILNPNNCNQATTTITINPFADLEIEKTVDNLIPGLNTDVTFTLTVTNNGPNPATGVVAVDELSSGFTYLSDNSVGAFDPDTGLWTIGDLATGASVNIEIVVTINSEGDFINTASVSGEQADPNMDNNTSVINLDPDALADVIIEKTLNNLTMDVNNNVIFTLTASNQGPGNASNVEVTDLLPDGFTYISHSGFGSYEPETGLWSIGNLSNGQSESLDITARVNPTGNYTNVASIEANETDPDNTNNTDEATVFAIPVADVAISKTVNQDRAPIGTQVVFTLTVTNLGPSEASDVVAVDLLSDGFTYISEIGEGTYNPVDGNWSIGTLENGANTSLQITALVNSDGDYTNVATVSSATKDPDEENNSDSVTVITTAEADLGIIKSSDKQRAHVGTEVVFTLTVTNYGPADATGVEVLDLLPDGFIYVDHNGDGSYNALTGEWDIDELANQLSVTLDITSRIRAGGNTTNLAEVTANEYDPITDNNIASLTVSVDNELVIPEGFSPNDDGYNDRFEIYGLEQYPNNQLLIVNRWGNKVFEASPYNNDWDGTNIFGVTVGGRDLPEGTYFYILDPGEDGMEPIKGFIYLKR